jgi:YD repeat-containing protein
MTNDGTYQTYTYYTYDNLGRVVETQQYNDVNEDGVDTAANQQTDDVLIGKSQTLYDSLGRVYETIQYGVDPTTGTVDFNTLVSNYWYDAAGNEVETADPLGQATTYEFDGLGRVVKVTQPDPDGSGPELAPWTVYTYDAAGNLLTQTDRLADTTTYAFDPLGREVSETDAQADVTTYAYDAAGNTASTTDPDDNTTSWTYDAAARVLSETNPLGTAEFVYDADGRVVRKSDRDGRVTTYQYDFLGRETAEEWLDGGENVIFTATYTYDLAGDLLSASDANATYVYTYNKLGEATSITEDIAGLGSTVVLGVPGTAYITLDKSDWFC